MKLENSFTVFATEEAKRTWDGKEIYAKKGRFKCPSCETASPALTARENIPHREEEE